MWTDIGANLADASFRNDLDDVLNRAAQAGVDEIVITGSCLASNARAAEIAENREGLYYTTGVHPHHAAEYDDQAHAMLRSQMASQAVVAAGECGLDYFRDIAPRDRQAHAFEQQLQLASERKLPVFLHQREAHDDFLDILDRHLSNIPNAVAHCFTAGEDELRAYVERDLYIGITGWICDERRGQHLIPLIKEIPEDRLMIETDAPYLLPRTIRPRPKTRRNEPAWLPEVGRVVAEALGVTNEELAALTRANARRFFGLPDT